MSFQSFLGTFIVVTCTIAGSCRCIVKQGAESYTGGVRLLARVRARPVQPLRFEEWLQLLRLSATLRTVAGRWSVSKDRPTLLACMRSSIILGINHERATVDLKRRFSESSL